MKKTRAKAEKLQNQEKALRKELAKSEKKLIARGKRAGLIALGSGITALLLYWAYKGFSSSKSSKKKADKKNRNTKKESRFGSVMDLFAPYLTKVLSQLLELDHGDDEKKTEKQDLDD